MCQDTGTAIIMGKRRAGLVWTDGERRGGARRGRPRRVSQKRTCAILSSRRSPCSRRRNTSNNMPAQVEIYAEGEGRLQAPVHRQGRRLRQTSRFLFQATSFDPHPGPHARLPEGKRCSRSAPRRALPTISPIVIGGTSAELTMKTVEARLDPLSRHPADHGARRTATPSAISKWEQEILGDGPSRWGWAPQFGGKYFCHDVRVVRPCRVTAPSLADRARRCRARPTARRLGKDHPRRPSFLEELEHNPAQYLPDLDGARLGGESGLRVDLNRPMPEILAAPTRSIPSRRGLSLTGPMIVAARTLGPIPSCCGRGWSKGQGLPGLFQEIIPSITPGRRRPRRAMPPARSARPPRGGWIPSSTISRGGPAAP